MAPGGGARQERLEGGQHGLSGGGGRQTTHVGEDPEQGPRIRLGIRHAPDDRRAAGQALDEIELAAAPQPVDDEVLRPVAPRDREVSRPQELARVGRALERLVLEGVRDMAGRWREGAE